MYTKISSKCQIVRTIVETGSAGKGGNQTGKKAKLGSILAIFSETTQLVDDLEVFNNLNTKDGAGTKEHHICGAAKICN